MKKRKTFYALGYPFPWKEGMKRMDTFSLKRFLKGEDSALYREVLDEELSWLLKYLREQKGLTQEALAERLKLSVEEVAHREERAGLTLTLEALARHVQALGLTLRLEFANEEGEVLARYHVGVDEPLGG